MSWEWYCDEHDTRGNADSKEEAEHVGDSHCEFKALFDEDWRMDDEEWCEITVYELIDAINDTPSGADTTVTYADNVTYVVFGKDEK